MLQTTNLQSLIYLFFYHLKITKKVIEKGFRVPWRISDFAKWSKYINYLDKIIFKSSVSFFSKCLFKGTFVGGRGTAGQIPSPAVHFTYQLLIVIVESKNYMCAWRKIIYIAVGQCTEQGLFFWDNGLSWLVEQKGILPKLETFWGYLEGERIDYQSPGSPRGRLDPGSNPLVAPDWKAALYHSPASVLKCR